MLLFYIAILFLLLASLGIKQEGIHADFLQKKQTNTIKGVFILMVYISHCMIEIRNSGYSFSSPLDSFGMSVRSEFGQLIVVMFLFYSGFGVMESIKSNGNDYVKHFPKRRVLTTLLNFDVAVSCFFLFNVILGISMSFKQVGMSLIGWNSLGNSNWYIFVILFCYFATWISAIVYPNSNIRAFFLITSLVFGGEIALSYLKRGQPWWYNTMLCYPLGVVYSIYKDRIVSYSKKYYFPILCVLLVGFLFFHFQHFMPDFHGLSFNAKSVLFALLIAHLSMKLKIENRFLLWAGANLFPIFIFQRLPMIGISNLLGQEWICSNPFTFFVLCALITGFIALSYSRWQIRLT